MGLFANPLSHAGYPPGVTGTPSTQPSEVRAATLAEAAAGVLNNCYISPSTLGGSVSLDFASPPVLGFGSTTPRPVAATTLSSTSTTTLGSGAGASVNVGSNATSVVNIGGTAGTLGFFGTTPTAGTTIAALTNSMTTTGTGNTISNFAGTTYATDGPIIAGDMNQMALKLNAVITALVNYGLL